MSQTKNYIPLSKELEERIREDRENHVKNPYACSDDAVIRRDMAHDKQTIWRPAFIRDCEKIMHIPYYNRYADKTQVFSLYKNDDISRRASHVQLVSRTARNIGQALNLNLDLIEAISIGHDIGHTPFGHEGERKLSQIYHDHTGRYFNHNIHSARVLDRIFPVNLSLQTLDGIICHNGEMEMQEYKPQAYTDFKVFDQKMEMCYTEKGATKKLIPATLEGCVMRVSDIIAYLGKDRQDAVKLGLIADDEAFEDRGIGKINAEIIHNMTVNIIERSYGKPYLQMDPEFYEAFSIGKKENYERIYAHDSNRKIFDEQIYPMFDAIYEKLREDLVNHDKTSVIYKHHMEYIREHTKYYAKDFAYEDEPVDDIVVDYIASMTDDYFIDLYEYLFPHGKYKVRYIGYFE